MHILLVLLILHCITTTSDGIEFLVDSLHHTMSFPSLSTEMVCKILVEANCTSPFCLPDPRSIPLTVTLVCRWLRNIALACQPLWMFYIAGPELLRNCRLYLARAGNSVVHIYALSVVSPPNPEVYDILTGHTVSQSFSLRDHFSLYRQGPVAISIRNVWMRCPVQMHLTELFINAPAAKALMQSISAHPNFFSNHAPLRHIVRLTLTGVNMPLAAQFIHLMPAITHLTAIPPKTQPVMSITAPIVMPHLVHLSLVSSPHDRFYGAIVAPKLSVLRLDFGRSDQALIRFKNHISYVSTLSLSGRIRLVDLTFRNLLNPTSMTVLRLDPLPGGDSDLPHELLSLMHQHPAVLPNVRELQTNTVWSRSALEILGTLRQPHLTLTIFIACASPVSPFPGKERIQHLCKKQIVRIVRVF